MIKDIEFLSKIRKLGTKYADIGLTVNVEISQWGVTFHGYWDESLNKYDVKGFNRLYDYAMLDQMPEDWDLEYLIDEFKDEFEAKLKEE